MNNVHTIHSHTHTDTQRQDSAKAQSTASSETLIINWKICAQTNFIVFHILLCVRGMKWKTETMLLTKALVFGSGSLSIATHCHVHMFVCGEYMNPQSTIVRKIIIESLLRYVSLHHFGASSICFFLIHTKLRHFALGLTCDKNWMKNWFFRLAPFDSIINLPNEWK